MRFVVDSNILVSFAIRPNSEFEQLFDEIATRGTTLVSEETLTELSDVMSRNKFRKYIPHDQSLDYIEWYAGVSEVVTITEKIAVCQDPKDDKFIELAVSGQADFIITGDRHLLVMKSFRTIPILSPSEFLVASTG